MFLSEEVSDNMFAAVEDAYSATEAFEQDVLNFFLDGQADFRGHANFNLRAKSLLNSRVVVDEKEQNKGTGTALMQYLLNLARSLHISKISLSLKRLFPMNSI